MTDSPEPTYAQVKLRLRDDLKKRLEIEAKAEKKSVNEVVVSKLEESYNNRDFFDMMVKRRFGDDISYKTLCAIGSSWDLFSTIKRSAWHETPETRELGMTTANTIMMMVANGSTELPPNLPDERGEEIRRNLRYTLGNMVASFVTTSGRSDKEAEASAKNISDAWEALRKMDVVALYEDLKAKGIISDEDPENGLKEIQHRTS